MYRYASYIFFLWSYDMLTRLQIYSVYMMMLLWIYLSVSLSSPNSFVSIYGSLLSQFLCKLYLILFSIDASKSSKRKAARGMSTPQYTYCVARTTFRGQICLYWCFWFLFIESSLKFLLWTAHALGVSAAWVVQSIIEVYRCFIRKPSDDYEALPSDSDDQFLDMNKFRLFGRKIYGITIKSCFSLVLASVGAGLGALVHPVHGQWFGES